jgi:hypothetical protein
MMTDNPDVAPVVACGTHQERRAEKQFSELFFVRFDRTMMRSESFFARFNSFSLGSDSLSAPQVRLGNVASFRTRLINPERIEFE